MATQTKERTMRPFAQVSGGDDLPASLLKPLVYNWDNTSNVFIL